MTPRVKICGIRRVEDALAAAEAGAQAIGLVFAPSPRQVTPEQAARIVEALPPLVLSVGVFVDTQENELREILARVHLGAVQLHGSQSPGFARDLGRPIVKAMTLKSIQDVSSVRAFRAAIPGAWILVDAPRPGSGEACDWELAAQLAREMPIVLAGGLRPENVGEAVRRVAPAAVDVSSGVESAPGQKDPARIRAFIDAVRGTCRGEN